MPSQCGLNLAFLSDAGESIGIHEGFRQTALLADSEPFTAALVTDSKSPLQPTSKIIYSKGASILLMLQNLLEAGQPGSFQARSQYALHTITTRVAYAYQCQALAYCTRILSYLMSAKLSRDVKAGLHIASMTINNVSLKQ